MFPPIGHSQEPKTSKIMTAKDLDLHDLTDSPEGLVPRGLEELEKPGSA
jgi:hypothetical protein